MIKINLIAETPAAAAAPKRRGPEISLGAKQGDVILMVMLLLGVAVVGGRWYMLDAHKKELKRVEADRRRERDELQQFIDKVAELEQKRELLRRKVEVINGLKSAQTGPVRIMDEISRALPELVWLDQMNLTGTTLTLNGQAMDENAVANYIANIDASPFFQEPTLTDMSRRGEVFSFSMTCIFSPTPQGADAAGGGAGA